MITSIVYGLVAFIEVILGLRFFFRLTGANPASGFVDFVYDLSTPLVTPFAGIFGQNATVTGSGAVVASVFEWTTLIAILVFGLIGGVVSGLFGRMTRRAV